jgi:short-subunit dehydrogenase
MVVKTLGRWVGRVGDLEGKNALVTGAQRRIGAAIARRLAREGASVWIKPCR